MKSELGEEAGPLELSPKQLEMVKEAIKAKEDGEPSFTAQEARDQARARAKAWMTPSQSA